MEPFVIGYLTDCPAKQYCAAIRRAESRRALVRAIEPYAECADDALALAKEMDKVSWEQFRVDRLKVGTAKGVEAEEIVKRFGAIFMPLKMFKAEMVSQHFKAPWGCAFIRLYRDGLDKIASDTQKVLDK